MENKTILGLDVSTACIGYCIMIDDGSDFGKILTLGHISPKVGKGVKGIESLFIKKKIFYDEFIGKFKDFKIDEVIIEEPLLRSNNVNTVSVLLQFNGMISACIYEQLGIVPKYISSYDARRFSFPELMEIRKFDKKGEFYPKKQIMKKLANNEFTLFGGYVWDCGKKEIIQGLVSSLFNNIDWIVDKKGQLKKENFDACDAYVACLGYLNKSRHEEALEIKAENITEASNGIEYDAVYWGRKVPRKIIF